MLVFANNEFLSSLLLKNRDRGGILMPLSLMKSGESAVIKKITGRDDIRNFLAGIGFVEGENVTVISEIAGDMILSIKNTRIALSKNMTLRVIV